MLTSKAQIKISCCAKMVHSWLVLPRKKKIIRKPFSGRQTFLRHFDKVIFLSVCQMAIQINFRLTVLRVFALIYRESPVSVPHLFNRGRKDLKKDWNLEPRKKQDG